MFICFDKQKTINAVKCQKSEVKKKEEILSTVNSDFNSTTTTTTTMNFHNKIGKIWVCLWNILLIYIERIQDKKTRKAGSIDQYNCIFIIYNLKN